LVVPNRGRDTAKVALFTGALTLCTLTYDLGPLLLALLIYGLARSVRGWPLVLSLAGAYVLTLAFTGVVTNVLSITINPQNSEQISDSISGFKHEVLHPTLPHWYDHLVSIPPSYVHLLLQAFFVVPVVVALFGIPKLRGRRPLAVLVAAVFATNFATIALFQIADARFLQTLPRLVYPVFPIVYLLAAIALDPGERGSAPIGSGRRGEILGRLRWAAPWIVVGLMFVLVNVDIFGYPTQYVEFFVSDPPIFLPN
jgi:hypothetical protein